MDLRNKLRKSNGSRMHGRMDGFFQSQKGTQSVSAFQIPRKLTSYPEGNIKVDRFFNEQERDEFKERDNVFPNRDSHNGPDERGNRREFGRKVGDLKEHGRIYNDERRKRNDGFSEGRPAEGRRFSVSSKEHLKRHSWNDDFEQAEDPKRYRFDREEEEVLRGHKRNFIQDHHEPKEVILRGDSSRRSFERRSNRRTHDVTEVDLPEDHIRRERRSEDSWSHDRRNNRRTHNTAEVDLVYDHFQREKRSEEARSYERRSNRRTHDVAAEDLAEDHFQRERRSHDPWPPQTHGSRNSFEEHERRIDETPKRNHREERDDWKPTDQLFERRDKHVKRNNWSEEFKGGHNISESTRDEFTLTRDNYDRRSHYDRREGSNDIADWKEDNEFSSKNMGGHRGRQRHSLSKERCNPPHRESCSPSRRVVDKRGGHDEFLPNKADQQIPPKLNRLETTDDTGRFRHRRFYRKDTPVFMAVVDISEPKKLICAEKAELLMKRFETMVKNAVLYLPKTEQPLKFRGLGWRDGKVLIMGADRFACQYFKDEIRKMLPPWPGAQLRTSRVGQEGYTEGFVTLTVPKSIDHLSEFYDICKKSDNRMQTETWRRIECEDNSSGKLCDLAIDIKSCQVIKSSRYEIQCGDKRLKVIKSFQQLETIVPKSWFF